MIASVFHVAFKNTRFIGNYVKKNTVTFHGLCNVCVSTCVTDPDSCMCGHWWINTTEENCFSFFSIALIFHVVSATFIFLLCLVQTAESFATQCQYNKINIIAVIVNVVLPFSFLVNSTILSLLQLSLITYIQLPIQHLLFLVDFTDNVLCYILGEPAVRPLFYYPRL